MSQSINYYIQLPNALSTAIDGMDKKQLTEFALEILIQLDVLNNFVDVSWSQATDCKRFMEKYNLESEDDMLKLAHGLLTKAI